jgi:hypothetical protein
MTQSAGRRRLELKPETSVFVNCPFDAEYANLFDAIIFATVCCGFVPRSALESGTVADPRITRILEPLCSSKYSIHDLSRCRGEGDGRLARFNMPLELGMAMARRHLTRVKAKRHDWLVLVPSGHLYLQFISDLGAFDPKTHDSSVEGVLQPVMVWLASRPDAIRTPTFQEVLAALPNFQAKRRQLATAWGGGDIPWRLVLEAATDAVPKF